MDQLLFCLTESTAKMMIAGLLLSGIWTVVSGNSFVCLSVLLL